MLIDAHCHINSLSGETQKNILNNSSGYIFIDISVDLNSSLESISLSCSYDFVYTSLGFHPLGGRQFSSDTINKYRDFLLDNKKIVAIGEVGLDYKAALSYQQQRSILEKFISLSKEFDLPLMLHNRWHNDEIFSILDKYFTDYSKVIFHCFSQDINFLKHIIEKKGNVSFSLNILRRKNKLDEALKYIPLDNLLLETDSPYMKIYGEYSIPFDIIKVYNYTAHIRNISLDELKNTVYSNAKRIFSF